MRILKGFVATRKRIDQNNREILIFEFESFDKTGAQLRKIYGQAITLWMKCKQKNCVSNLGNVTEEFFSGRIKNLFAHWINGRFHKDSFSDFVFVLANLRHHINQFQAAWEWRRFRRSQCLSSLPSWNFSRSFNSIWSRWNTLGFLDIHIGGSEKTIHQKFNPAESGPSKISLN